MGYGTGQAVDKEGCDAFKPVVRLRSDDQPVVALTQTVFRDGSASSDSYLRRWHPTLQKWVDVGVPVDNNVAFNAQNPSLVLRRDNNPTVSWDEFDGSSSNVYVKQY